MNLDDIVATIHGEMGGRGCIDDIAHHIRNTHPDLYHDKAFVAFKSIVRGSLRKIDADTGLPRALSAGGQYIQTTLLTPGEYREVCRSYMRRSRGNQRIAELLAEQCAAVHGVEIDLTDLGEVTA